MQVTLHGGPHDGRRITIDPAVAARGTILIPDRVKIELPEPDEEFPTSPPWQHISIYRARRWADGPSTGPLSPYPPHYWLRWEYEGSR